MRRINNWLKKSDFDPDIVVYDDFPLANITPIWSSTLVGIRIMVDPELGDDNNDGATWKTAVKSIAKAVSLLPYDIKGAHAIILLHGGEHYITEGNTPLITSNNGTVRICWVGTFVNESSAKPDVIGFYEWVRNGEPNPIRNDNPANIQFDPNAVNTWTLFWLSASNTEFSLCQQDFNYAWNQVGFAYWDKLRLIGYEGRTPTSYPALFGGGMPNSKFTSDSGFTIDLKNARISSDFAFITGFVNVLKVIGGTGEASTSTSGWRGIFGLSIEASFKFLTGAISFAIGFEPEFKQFDFRNFSSNFITCFPSGDPKTAYLGLMKTSTYLYVDNSAIGNAKIGLHIGNGLSKLHSISYNSDYFNLVYASNSLASIKKYNDAGTLLETKNYLNEKIYDDGTNLFFNNIQVN